MLKKMAVMVVLGLASSSVFAAGEATSIINISATIPTKQFHVLPNDPNWGRNEVMNYNPVTGLLSSLRQVYNVKNTDGSVHAYIEGGPAALTNGSSSIALTTSTPGTQADMVIVAAKPADTQAGEFTANNMTVVFDNVPRVTP